MKKRALPATLLAGLALLLGFSACQPASPDTNREAARATNANVAKETVDKAAIEADLLRIEREWADAVKGHNADVVRRVVADDVAMTYPDGTTGTKADEIRDAESGALTAGAYDLIDTKVQVLATDAAVVTGRTVFKNAKYKGPDGKTIDISGEYRFTDVFARRNGAWQVVASQATRVENPSPMTSPATKPSPVSSPPPPPARVSPSASMKPSP